MRARRSGVAVAFLSLVLLLLASLQQAHAQRRNDEPGRFDFYVLSLSWSPSYCESARRADPGQCAQGRPFSFVVHGLWPQHESGYPQFCQRQADWIPEPILQSMLELMPSRQLIVNEWRKHGTCSGLAPEGYFALVRRARERVTIPESFRRLDDYRMVSPNEVETAFMAANPGLERDMIAVDCDRRYLREVRICMGKDLAFRPCPEVDRRACREPRIVMPPIRGTVQRL
jgi:ribonuclease T2